MHAQYVLVINSIYSKPSSGKVKCGSCRGTGRKRVYRKGKHEVKRCFSCSGRGKKRYLKFQ